MLKVYFNQIKIRSLDNRLKRLWITNHDSLLRQMDRFLAGLMVVQWLFHILFSRWIPQHTYAATERHTLAVIWAVVGDGGIIAAVAVLLAWHCPGCKVTRHFMAVAQLLFGSLLIHLTSGPVETQLHTFGSLALLAFYPDWRVVTTGLMAVTVGLLCRGSSLSLNVLG